MAETVELRTFSIRNQPDGDHIEEYQEIRHDEKQLGSLDTESFISKYLPESIDHHDFFTQDGKTETKENKKKMRKKKEKPSNIMDIISSEIASLAVSITENVTEMVEDRQNYQNAYVQSYSRDQRKYQRIKTVLDTEYGQTRMMRAHKLSPIYPNLLETFAEELHLDIPVDYVGPSFFSDLLNEYSSRADKDQPIKFLDITLKDIKFKHRHDFSLEDVLCIKLIDIYKEYENLLERIKDVSHDMKVNRETKDNLKKDLLKVSPNNKDDIRLDITVRKYAGQLFKLKGNYRELLKDKKERAHKMISIWSDIEMTREKFGQNTAYILKIDKHTLSKNEFEKAWNRLYEEEWTDMLAKIEYDYGTKCIQYKEHKQGQNGDHKSRKKINKPKMNIDEDAIKEEVEEIVNNIIVRDIIDFSLEKDDRDITELKLLRHTYHFEIYVDKVFVCESEQYTSTDKWHNITFTEHFSIEILPNNNSLRIILKENEVNVAQIQANLNDLTKNNADQYTKINFLYDKDIALGPDFVGSGHSIKEIARDVTYLRHKYLRYRYKIQNTYLHLVSQILF